MVLLAVVTPGTADASCGTASLNPPGPFVFVFETIRLALTALSTLLVVDLESDAPKTVIVDTRANPTIRADAVCAVRRGPIRALRRCFATNTNGARSLARHGRLRKTE